ncbi:MAG: M48 family metalloprotease [Acidimicrobiales bacterium]
MSPPRTSNETPDSPRRAGGTAGAKSRPTSRSRSRSRAASTSNTRARASSAAKGRSKSATASTSLPPRKKKPDTKKPDTKKPDIRRRPAGNPARSSDFAAARTEVRESSLDLGSRLDHGDDAFASPAGRSLGELVDANRRRARGIALGAAAIVALPIGAGAGAIVALVVGVLPAIAAALVLWVAATVAAGGFIHSHATESVLRLLRARPTEVEAFPRLYNVVEGLCATYGLRPPRVMVVQDEVANACALGVSSKDAVLVVTTALAESLGLMEIEGVVAHELAHMKVRESAVSSVSISVLRHFGSSRGRDRMLLGLIGRGREFKADQMAVRAIRYPTGLRDALIELRSPGELQRQSLFSRPATAWTRHVWIDPSYAGNETVDTGDGEKGVSQSSLELDSTLDSVDVRIDALAEY